MSDTQQPWPGNAFPSAPTDQPVQAQPNAVTYSPADMTRLMAQQAAVPKRRYCAMTIPESAWPDASPADRTFGLFEPDAGEVKRWANAGSVDVHEQVQNFTAMIGGVEVTDNTAQVRPWFARMPGKVQTMLVNEFASMFIATEEEGKSLRASKQWVG